MKFRIYLYTLIFKLVFFLFFIVSPPLVANNNPNISPKVCQQMIEEAWEEILDQKYSSALEKLLKVEVIAAKNNWDEELWSAKRYIGITYANMSNYGEALKYFQEALAIIRTNQELQEEVPVILGAIGVLYEREKKYEEALHYMEEAYEILKKSGQNDIEKKNTANNIAGVYNKLNKPKESLKILSEVKEKVDKQPVDFLWEAIYIEAIFKNGQVVTAKDKALELYNQLNKTPYDDKNCYNCLNNLLSKIYEKLNDSDSAIYYLKRALNSTDELIIRIDSYKKISDLYLQKREFTTALQYKDSALRATDSLSSLMNRHLYEANKVKLRVAEYQSELNAKKKQQNAERKLFIAISILAILLLFSIYKVLKNKIVKQKQKAMIAGLQLEKEQKEHLLAEKELKMNRLKQEQLKHEVAEKNRELVSKVLYFTKRNKLIEDIIASLEASSKKHGDKEIGKQVRTIKNILKADDQQENFMNHFENVNPAFLKQLKSKHPELTSNDIRFLCYVFMNLSLKEISSIFNITYNTCEMRKRRIKIKMGLDKETSLYDYILGISQI